MEAQINAKAVHALQDFLAALGVDIQARGMEKTPARVTKLFQQLTAGGKLPTSFWGACFPSATQGLVAVRGLPFASLCEHHLVPFFGEVQIAYLPRDGKVAGFGKFQEAVRILAQEPSLQERLTHKIATAVQEGTQALGVLVVVEAEQLCMRMLGEAAPSARVMTSEALGVLQTNSALRQEAWQMLSRKVG